ncbi:S-adenosyl-L-methionine-dependent methyltransferase [Phialemonium atrogriseum]|uniref:S-adenosyl-L-methionine-dependent methyltransferase n=1 Tax=Phialemonium atrogriseum TaxID=1093897 RepID=A0AAJ0C6V8_9PEZI|nr:S-adenosyl-L-methionine-dependent methyltransferase [Phialemonium atrogriseum]KAK1771249.1 S-adenosyl-L-methionine-dependent methyltransferase [Phialemonium atrogriseum]
MTTSLTPSPTGETTELSKQYDTPMGLGHTTMQALKDRIKLHYDLASDYYLSLWGEHIHHGYWPTDESKARDSKEVAQISLIRLLLDLSQISSGSKVLDVGCGIGGTSRYLASQLGCSVTGLTISTKQVEIAKRLTKAEASKETPEGGTVATEDADGFLKLGKGKIRFIELDAEKMGDVFEGDSGTFDAVWISEALSHFPDKALFFQNAYKVLKTGGKLAVADWFKADTLGQKEFDSDIKPIEDGMLLPPLCTQAGYTQLATAAGLEEFGLPKDISKDVSKTWDISWSLVQNPSLWAFALSQGRDGIAFLQAFRAMRRGYSNGSFRYAVMAFQK